ncbi:tyrosine-type recombinase/integrase [Peloplasma aerotolerans]|uniref:Tyrosine-type recombinase/integrase n=1 Tax=Peloplasma aerotolerans TaxID=3044389 RepID=A0AAW6U8G8_9MOLU|nr:tyrosine-type recombinase/integrase [Mariniplasma sp. M4Ah]MDI6452373.1 tyrosine-type recombinase/integrase [Mariniplasma sp. M4Ah]
MIDHPLKKLSEHYLNEQDLSKSTIKTYRICYKYYLMYLIEHDILYAKTSDVIRFRESLRKRGHSTYYIHTYICALKSLYRYLRENQHRLSFPTEYTYDIMLAVKNEKIKPHLKKPLLNLDEAKHLLIYTKEHRKIIYDYRNYAIIALMITAGLSSHEIIHLKKVDYQMIDDHHVLLIEKNGTRHKDTVYLSKGVVEAIDDYLIKRRKKENPYLFISQNQTTPEGYLSRTFFYYMFEKVIKKCGLEHTNITPHSLRHTAAYLNLLRGGSIESTKRLLRHVDIKSTLVYVDYIDKLNDHTAESIESFILKEDFFNHDDVDFFNHFFKVY